MKIDQWSAEESENYLAKVGTLHPVALLLGDNAKTLKSMSIYNTVFHKWNSLLD